MYGPDALPDPEHLMWMPAHSEMTDLTIAEYEALPKKKTVNDTSEREAWYNEGKHNFPKEMVLL